MNLKHWILPTPVDVNQADEFARQLAIQPLTAAILIRRGFDTTPAIQRFLESKNQRLSDFRLLPGAVAAGELLAQAIRTKAKIMLFGDYDVDGVTASAVMVEFILARGGQIVPYLPDRYSEGYGLNRAFVEKAAAQGTQVLLTVDCGVTAIEEIALAKEKGMTVLVTDHHEPGAVLPNADVVVNPKVTGPDDLRLLAGVGVGLQVIRATAAALGEKDTEKLRQHLDLVALGTVADVVPLIGENRLLAKAGLAVLNRGHRLGLKALTTLAGLGLEPMNSTDLAFKIAPRLNAAGRMGDAHHSLNLLLAKDALEADGLAAKLNEENSKRQLVQKKVLQEAEQQLDRDHLPAAITVYGMNWPHGVVGLVAARLCEKYYRPCFALSVEDNIVKGSGRSIKGFPLHQILDEMAPLLLKWGGHEMAAGVTLHREKLSIFKQTLAELADKIFDQDSLKPELIIDAEADLGQINYQLTRELSRFEPFGFGNHKPLVLVRGIKLAGYPRVVGDRHLKLAVRDDRNHRLEVIGFGMSDRLPELENAGSLDMVGSPGENRWNGTTTVQLELKDLKAY